MSFTVERIPDEPIVVVTLQEPFEKSCPQLVTSAVLQNVMDITGRVYRITDFRYVNLTHELVRCELDNDITFTGFRVRSVVIGEGDMINFLLRCANTDYLQIERMVAFGNVDTALDHIRWEIASGLAAYA